MNTDTGAPEGTNDEAETIDADSLAEMIRLSASGFTKVRHILCQLPQGEASRVSTVGRLVTGRKHRELVLYLLLLTCWPWLQKQHKPLPGVVWCRALTVDKGPQWSVSTLSRVWSELVGAGLVTRQRRGRGVEFVPQREDGADEYTIPEGKADRWNTYFALPHSFWLDGVFAKLTFPGLAMLLIIAGETSKKSEFAFAFEWIKDWYGLSPKTVQNGINDLLKHDLVHRREERVKAPLSAIGHTTRIHYSLKGEYGQEARAALQEHARKERAKRLRKDSAAKDASPVRRTGNTTVRRQAVKAAKPRAASIAARKGRTTRTKKSPRPKPGISTRGSAVAGV